MNKIDAPLPDLQMELLAEKLEAYAEALIPAERDVVRGIIDRIIDPWDRLRRREGHQLFDKEEMAFLEHLEREQ